MINTCGLRLLLVGTEPGSGGVLLRFLRRGTRRARTAPTPRPPVVGVASPIGDEGRTRPPQTPLRMDGWCASLVFTFTPPWLLVGILYTHILHQCADTMVLKYN